MILKVFAVRDTKAQAFLQPFFSNSVGSALRAFGDAALDEKCPFNKHPADYILYEVGEYDDSNGLLSALELVKMLACASDFVNEAKVMPKEVLYDKTINVGLEEAVEKVDGKK